MDTETLRSKCTALTVLVNAKDAAENITGIQDLVQQINAIVDASDSAELKTLWNGQHLITAVFGQGTGRCNECPRLLSKIQQMQKTIQQLQDGMKKMTDTIAAMVAKEKDAIRRQFAITFETECKLAFLQAFDRSAQAAFIDPRDDELDYNRIKATSLDAFEDILKQQDPKTHLQLTDLIFPKDRKLFYRALFHLKKFADDAHPIALENEIVTSETARSLITTMSLREQPRNPLRTTYKRDDLNSIQAEALRMLSVLSVMRKDEAHLLANF